MGPQIWNNVPQDMCTFLVKTIQLHRHNTGTCMGGGAGQHRRYNGIRIYIMYILYVLLLLSLIQVVDWLQLQ